MNLLSSEIIRNGIDAYLGQFPAFSRKIYLLVIGFVGVNSKILLCLEKS